MQTHFDKGVAPSGELPVRAASANLAVILIGAVELYVEGPEDADRLIKAGAEAKRLMEAKAQEAAPVITDSGRTCGQANPGTGAWCHRDGDHGVHEDTNGDTWRTDGDGPAPGERCLEHSDPADDLYGQCVKRGPHKMHENVHHQQWSKPFRPAPAPGPAGGPFWCPATTGPDDELDQTLARS